MAITKGNLLEAILLELMCYVPVAIIVGNILPPLEGLKIHWIYIGVIFLVTLVLVFKNKRSHHILFLLLVFAVIQLFTSIEFSLADFIDFISGPLLFVAITNIVTLDKFEPHVLKRYRKRILLGFAVPISIAFLQSIKLLPLEFLNATYVNVTLYGTERLTRVNGFLYHGIELAVIIFFFFTSVGLFMSNARAYAVLFIMIFFEFMSIIKTGIITAILYTIFFSYFIDRRLRSVKSVVIASVIFFGFSYVYILIPDIEADRFEFNKKEIKFEDELFTGRGFIWNMYIRGIKHFDASQIAFGGGFGSAPIIFRENSISVHAWAPGPHNQLLDLFINGGVVAILFIVYILRRQYKRLARLFTHDRATFRKYYLGVVLIPLIIMGVTAPIMGMFVYWCGLSVVVITFKLKFS